MYKIIILYKSAYGVLNRCLGGKLTMKNLDV